MWSRLRAYLRRWSRSGVVQLRGHDAFISYNHKDAQPYARALWKALETDGLTVFLDESDLESGDPLSESLKKKVGGAQDLILLDTPGAAASRYVIEEVDTAINCRKNIIPIKFTCLAETKYQWPQAAVLDNRIAIRDDALPTAEPSSDAIDRVVRAHGARRRRRQAFAIATVTVTGLFMAIGFITVSVTARRRAEAAVAGFADPTISMAEARRRGVEVLNSWLFWLFDVFANKQHWQLVNLLETTHLKARSPLPDVGAVAGPARCVSSASDQGECLAESASWRIHTKPDDDELVARSRDGVTVQLASTESPRVVRTAGDFVATTAGTRVMLWRLSQEPSSKIDSYATLALGDAKTLEFSSDARQLLVLSRPDYLNAWAATLVDVRSGAIMQSAPLGGSQGGDDASRHCQDGEDSIVWSDRKARVCSSGAASVFEVLPPLDLPTYELDDEARGNRVRGGDVAADGTVAFWLQTGKVYLCTARCSIALIEDQIGDQKIDRLSIASRSAGAYDLVLTMANSRRFVWHCQSGPAISCTPGPQDTAPKRLLGASPQGMTIEVNHLDNPLVRSADGAVVGSPSQEIFMRPGMRATAAAFDQSGAFFIAMTSDAASLVAIGRQSVAGGIHWNALMTFPVLAIHLAKDGRQFTTLERWNASLVRRTYTGWPQGYIDVHARSAVR